jgi:hypothetical protein
MVLNLTSLQSMLSTINGERERKISQEIFLDEDLGFKNNSSRTRNHSELMRTACPKSKSGYGSSKT